MSLIRYLVFTVGLKGVEIERVDRVEPLILSSLEK